MNKHIFIIAGMIGLTVAITAILDRKENEVSDSASASPAKPSSLLTSTSKRATSTNLERAATHENGDNITWWERQPRPFPVTHTSSSGFQWTDTASKDEAVLKQLANNTEMLKSLKSENAWVKRRQLVYTPASFSTDAKKIYQNELDTIIIPAFNGMELTLEIDPEAVYPQNIETISGGFVAKIKGIAESNVIAASENDTWSIGVQIGDVHYQIETREPGEWLLTEVDFVEMNKHVGPCLTGAGHSDDTVGPPISTLSSVEQ